MIQDYEQLLRATSMSNLTATFIPGSNVTMKVTQQDLPAGLATDLKFTFELCNMGEFEIPAGTIFRVYDAEKAYLDSFFNLPSKLEPRETGGESLTFDITVKQKRPIRTIDHMPTRLYAELLERVTKDRYRLEENVLFMEVHNMWADLAAWAPPPQSNLNHVNILAFGWKGAGKSTLLNRILETITSEKHISVCHSMRSADHVTMKVKKVGWELVNLTDSDEAEMWAQKLQDIFYVV